MRDSEANAFTRSRGEMHRFWISMHERGHLTACVSNQRSRHLAIDMLHAVRVAKRGGHRVHDDGCHRRIDWGRRVVIKIDGGRGGQLHVWCFLVCSPCVGRNAVCPRTLINSLEPCSATLACFLGDTEVATPSTGQRTCNVTRSQNPSPCIYGLSENQCLSN